MASVLIYTITVSGLYGEVYSYYTTLMSPPLDVDSGTAVELSYIHKGLPNPYWTESGADRVISSNDTRPFTYSFRLEKSSGLAFSGMSVTCPSDDIDESVCFREFEDGDFTYLLVGCPTQMSASGRVNVGLSFSIVRKQSSGDSGGVVNVRPGRPFAFKVDGVEILPPEGASLSFASMDVDTLSLPGLPAGLVSKGSVAEVSYKGLKVFRGTPASRVERWGRGNTHFEDVTFEGPWGNLARLVYLQEWSCTGTRNGTSVSLSVSNARCILNQTGDGTPQNMTDQIREIAAFAADKCGFSYSSGSIDAGTQVLPADEATDITCAAAIVRTMRFFPKMIARFDYSGTSPVLRVGTPTSSFSVEAGILSRSLTRKDHPIVGVEIVTNTTRTTIEVGGQTIDTRSFDKQSAGDVNSLDCLRIYMPLASGGRSTEYETLDCTGHVKTGWVVPNVKDKAFFWCKYHPRLREINQSSVTIDSASVKVVDPIDQETTVSPFKYITDLTVGDLRHFGQDAVACRFVCKAKIDTGDDIEEDVVLTMDFVTTNAVQRTYTQMVGMSNEEAETIPEGLAQAILDQRAGELESEDLRIRLGDSIPVIGENKDGLYLQSMAIDCHDLTADLHFGHPNYLSAEEMRDLLSGFRGRSFSSSHIDRDNPDPDEESEETSGIHPLASTEFCPGKSSKKVFRKSGDSPTSSVTVDASGERPNVRVDGQNNSIILDTGDFPDDCKGEIKIHEFKYKGKDGNVHVFHGLFCDDIDITELYHPKDEDDGGNTSGSGTEEYVKQNVIVGITYDENTRQLTPTYKKLTVKSSEDVEDTVVPIFTAVEHTAGMDG